MPTSNVIGVVRGAKRMATETSSRTCTPYVCECGAHLWDTITRPDGSAYLVLAGGLIVTEIACGCGACGREHHWTQATERLRRILALRRRDVE
jgi:hypothetical protein